MLAYRPPVERELASSLLVVEARVAKDSSVASPAFHWSHSSRAFVSAASNCSCVGLVVLVSPARTSRWRTVWVSSWSSSRPSKRTT